MINLLKGKILGATHGKNGIWLQKHDLSKVFGIKWLFFHLQCLFIFLEVITNPMKNLISEKKVGVTHEKMGIWPQKWLKKGKIDDDVPSYYLEWTKTT